MVRRALSTRGTALASDPLSCRNSRASHRAGAAIAEIRVVVDRLSVMRSEQYVLPLCLVMGSPACRPSTAPVVAEVSAESLEPPAPPTVDLVLRDAVVLTGLDEKPLHDHAIAIQDAVITWVGPSGQAPTGEQEIDLKGQFVVPGLIDMHVHVRDPAEFDLYLLNGVTTVVNLSGNPDHLAWRDAIIRGEQRGPTLYTAGPTLDGDPARNNRFVPIGSVDVAKKTVDGIADAGYDLIKVYDLIGKEPYDAVVAAAKAHDLPVVGHLPKAFGLEGVLGGHDLIAHAEEYFYTFFANEADHSRIPAAVDLTRRAGLAVCPNTAFIRAIIQQAKDLDAVLAWPEVKYLPPASLIHWLPETNRYLNRGDTWLARNERMYPFLLELTKALHEGGVPLVTGTDAAVPGGVPGFALHREIEDLSSAGLSSADALAAATTNPGRWLEQHLGLEHAPGTIEVGGAADMLVVRANPLQNLDVLETPDVVVSRGQPLARSVLLAAADAKAASYLPAWAEYERFKAAVVARDFGTAESMLRATLQQRDGSPDRPTLLGEDFINAYAYSLLLHPSTSSAALELFLLNTRAFPKSVNAWDSLGEAYQKTGKLKNAAAAYQQVLALDPENTNARQALKKPRTTK